MRRRAGEVGGTKNVAKLSLDKAVEYTEETWKEKGVKGEKDPKIEKVIPNFEDNYLLLQKKLQRAPNIPRVQMPVIEPTDMEAFAKALKAGHIDIFPPFTKGKFPSVGKSWGAMSKEEGEEWLTLGVQDGDPNDDKINASVKKIPSRTLLPTQNEIWLEKLVNGISKFGVPTSSSSITKQTLICSEEHYILDGHHRFAQVMLADPGIGMETLRIGLDIDQLLEVGRGFGAAIGNTPKAGSLKARLIRLAYTHPHLRNQILPLLQK
jgi:hypothetical protein